MPSFAVLWFLALQLLALAAPRSFASQPDAGRRATAGWAARTDETTSPLRPAARLATIAAPRVTHAPPRPPGAPTVASAPLRLGAPDIEPTPSLDRSHAAATRGGVLPYFPTAPPVVG